MGEAMNAHKIVQIVWDDDLPILGPLGRWETKEVIFRLGR